jgi:hypothetical protein
MTQRKDWGQPQVGPQGFARNQKTIGRVVTLAATDLVTGNIVGAFMVPAGFTVLGITGVPSDMDSGAALLLSVGDAALGTRFLSSSTAGQAATLITAFSAVTPGTNLLFKYTVDTEIIITCTLQGSSSVAGTLGLYLNGFMDN